MAGQSAQRPEGILDKALDTLDRGVVNEVFVGPMWVKEGHNGGNPGSDFRGGAAMKSANAVIVLLAVFAFSQTPYISELKQKAERGDSEAQYCCPL